MQVVYQCWRLFGRRRLPQEAPQRGLLPICPASLTGLCKDLFPKLHPFLATKTWPLLSLPVTSSCLCLNSLDLFFMPFLPLAINRFDSRTGNKKLTYLAWLWARLLTPNCRVRLFSYFLSFLDFFQEADANNALINSLTICHQ